MKTAVSQNGRVSKSVNVYTSEPGAKNLRLRFTVDVRMPIAATPSFRFVLNTIEGQDASQRILLRRTDGEPLEIRRTKVPLTGVTVTAHAVDNPPPQASPQPEATQTPWGEAHQQKTQAAETGDVWLDMEASTSLAAGRYSDAVRLATNHPEAPEIEIPFTIRVRPLIEARPAVVRMWTAPTTNSPGRSGIVTLQHHGDRSFGVSSIEVSHPEIFTAVAYGKDPSTQQSIRTALVEGLDAATLGASFEGWIRVTTDDPEKPILEIPVLVAPTRTLSRRPVDGRR